MATTGEVRIVKLDASGHPVMSYAGQIVYADGEVVVARCLWTESKPFQVGPFCLEAGDVFIECYFRERWFNIFAIYNAQGILKGWYSNITTAPEIHSGMIHWRDLALDVLRLPNGREWILDEDEFEALDLSPHERGRARKALATIQRWARERRFPFSLH